MKPLSQSILLHIAKSLSVPLQGLVAVIGLLDGGGTVPFIARYRKEATGNLDEVQIRGIEEKVAYFRELEDRRATVLRSVEEQGKLTPELRATIEAILDRSELEDVYLPYRPKRRTKAMIAREKGLEPLALYIWNQAPGSLSLLDLARTLGPVEQSLEGARHIVAEMVSESADLRKGLRSMMLTEGIVVSRAADDAEKKDEQRKFQMYYDFREPAAKIASHRMLAVRRGETEGILHLNIELEKGRPAAWLKRQLLRHEGDWTAQFELAIDDAWKRLLSLSLESEVRLELKQRADAEAIRVFQENLRNLLLSPPAGQLSVLGIDPGVRTGCKLAVVDDTGRFLEHSVIYPHQPRNDFAGSSRTVKDLIAKHGVRAIAIGNGTASRETDLFIRAFLKEQNLTDIFSATVNEAGASIYSASDLAREEFPDLDLTVRGAISIARRLQDPLAELVKIDPKSIGVGQYQHDVDQNHLHDALGKTVESCVNRVGVDLNTSSWALLQYVAGVNERVAKNIVAYRNENGRFRSRGQLTKVPGVGPKTFEQAAGFLRIRGGDNPLDSTAVHPESYALVQQILDTLGVSVPQLVAQPALVEKVDRSRLAGGRYTLADILEELKKPGRDPREQFVMPNFATEVTGIADLKPGMALEGVVTNVTKFGAFVDIGVHHDGLVHVSELSNRFIKDPAEAVKVGQIVKVQVISADPKTRRIALSMKALLPPAAPARQPAPAPSIDGKLSALADRWKTR